MDRLDARQVVPLTGGDLELLRDAATRADITPGLFARALIRWALENLDGDALEAAVDQEQAEATAAANRAKRGVTARNCAPGAPQAGNGRYATVPPPPPGDGSNALDARAARRAVRSDILEQVNQQQGGHWN